MEKNYFHNDRSLDENLNEIRTSQRKYTDKKKVVDINKLLNRVKINESDKKKKILLLFFVQFHVYLYLLISFLIKNFKLTFNK